MIFKALFSLVLVLTSNSTDSVGSQSLTNVNQDSTYAAAKKCNVGFLKGKTPLKADGKVACINKKAASAGKKLLTAMTSTCAACHGALSIAPFKTMTARMRAMNLTIKAADLVVAFNAHQSEMAGATMTAKDSKNISAFLQSIK